MVAIATPHPSALPTTDPARRRVDAAGRRGLVVVPAPAGGATAGLEWTWARLGPQLSRLALGALALLAAVALVVLATTAGPGAAAPTAPATHVVGVGESLWSIATAHAPAGEAAGYVERLVAVNATTVVAPGDVIELPRP